MDSSQVIVCSGIILGLSALTGTASAQARFAWACRPTTASYDAITLCSPWVVCNSGYGGVQITRPGTGVCQVDFGGVGGDRTTEGGRVQLTTHLDGSTVFEIICNSVRWRSGIANVRCAEEAKHP
jgi:hypothetical protein